MRLKKLNSFRHVTIHTTAQTDKYHSKMTTSLQNKLLATWTIELQINPNTLPNVFQLNVYHLTLIITCFSSIGTVNFTQSLRVPKQSSIPQYNYTHTNYMTVCYMSGNLMHSLIHTASLNCMPIYLGYTQFSISLHDHFVRHMPLLTASRSNRAVTL